MHNSFLVISTALFFIAETANAQGFVQERSSRHHASEAGNATCEEWRGEIHGNDPTAEILVELCTDGSHVTGSFYWSSRESGWDRRVLQGEWHDNTFLTARDTAMLESHPQRGWTLCTADGYNLRRVGENRLEGTYFSNSCHDHGDLVMVRRTSQTEVQTTVASKAVELSAQSPDVRTQKTMGAARCSAVPGMYTQRWGWAGVLTCVALIIAGRRRKS
jgi:hypothetical protein